MKTVIVILMMVSTLMFATPQGENESATKESKEIKECVVNEGDILAVRYTNKADSMVTGFKKVLIVDIQKEWVIFSKINQNIEDGQVYGLELILSQAKGQAEGKTFDISWLDGVECFDWLGKVDPECDLYTEMNNKYFKKTK